MKEVDENADHAAIVNKINNLWTTFKKGTQEGNSIKKIRGKC
jgi:hypothetical protein